jgi:uncharacterized membrane protein YphA (DoxX/SURF4 family)
MKTFFTKYFQNIGMGVGAALVLAGILQAAGGVKALLGVGASAFAIFFFYDKVVAEFKKVEVDIKKAV